MTQLTTNPTIAKLYRDVPAELVEQLQQFREKYPYKTTTIDGTSWRYIDTGTGKQVVLALSGATCIAEISWQTIERLGQKYRVIAPDYPAIDSNAELVDGLTSLLEQEGIERAHVMGGSYGGLVAQVFVRRHPDRTAGLILSHTLLPNPETGRAIAKTLRWLRLMPQPLLRLFFKRTMSRLMTRNAAPEMALINAHFAEIVDFHMTKAQIVSLMARTIDVSESYTFTPGDLKDWPGRVLLMMADDDPATPEPMRRAIMSMYPQATVRLFSGSGHLTSILKQDEYIGAMEEFVGK
ncbi:MAG: alpha/beta hydrolase [Anaerolineae bacterium]|nr:alpha/beta hydrolase [Anaerolineae bacterium]